MNSILGIFSQLYRLKSSQGGSILDDPDKGLLEIWPAGYTYPNEEGFRRQDFYKKLWKKAVSLSTQNSTYPFDINQHYVKLVSDSSNTHDANAIKILLYNSSKEMTGNYISDLGFIPKKINQVLLKNIDMVNEVKILKVRKNFHKKYYTAKIVIAYGTNTFCQLSATTLNRFTSLLEE